MASRMAMLGYGFADYDTEPRILRGESQMISGAQLLEVDLRSDRSERSWNRPT